MIVDAHVHLYRAAEQIAGHRHLSDHLARVGATAAVIVQPSAEGGTSRWLDDVLPRAPLTGDAAGLGVVLAATDSRGAPLPSPGLAGAVPDPRVRGLRLAPLHASDWRWSAPEVEALIRLARGHGLVLELLVRPGQLAGVDAWLADHPDVDVVIDHLGRPDLDRGAADRLLALGRHRRCAVKASALGTISARRWPYPDLAPLLADVLAAFGSARLMWGSDFPHLRDADRPDRLADVLPTASPAQLADLAGHSARHWYRPDGPPPPPAPEG